MPSNKLELSVSNINQGPDSLFRNDNNLSKEQSYLDDDNYYDSSWSETIEESLIKDYSHINLNNQSATYDVCGSDDRIHIRNSTRAPFKYICKLFITWASGKKDTGTGFFINKRCIATSGHVVFKKKHGWAKSITVVPGMSGRNAPFGSIVSDKFYSVYGWFRDNDKDYDHGCIILPSNSMYQKVRGFFKHKATVGLPTIHTCGYPYDKSRIKPNTQWYSRGKSNKRTEFRFFYMADTNRGHSGSPVWIINKSSYYVTGVHSYGGCPNSCIRVQGYVLDRWREWGAL